MMKKNEGVDIVQEIGAIQTLPEAEQFLQQQLDADGFSRLERIKLPAARLKIANAIAMCRPDSVFINTGSEADRQFIRDLSIEKGEESKLPMPDHTIHFDLKEEQGRIIDRTFYLANPNDLVSSLANRIDRSEAMEDIRRKMTGIMQGKVMMVGFYIRGPIGAPVSDPALEISSSTYVMHSAELLYRNAYETFDKQVEQTGYFYTNIHSEGLNRPEDLPHARVYMDRSYQTTYSMNCTYAGNTLLMKKGNHRFSVDRSVYEKRGAGACRAHVHYRY